MHRYTHIPHIPTHTDTYIHRRYTFPHIHTCRCTHSYLYTHSPHLHTQGHVHKYMRIPTNILTFTDRFKFPPFTDRHTHIHSYTRLHICTYVHRRTHILHIHSEGTHNRRWICISPAFTICPQSIHICTQIHTHTYTHIPPHQYSHMCSCIHIHGITHTHTHMHTHHRPQLCPELWNQSKALRFAAFWGAPVSFVQ